MYQNQIKICKAVMTNSSFKSCSAQECHDPTFKQVCFDLGVGKGVRE